MVSLAISHLEHHVDHVRAAGAEVLGTFAEIGDGTVLAMLIAHLKDAAAIVVQAVVAAICQIATRDSQDVLDVLLPFLEHPDPWVKEVVLGAIALIGVADNDATVPALLACLDSADGKTVEAALRAFVTMGVSSSQQIVAAICACLDHRDEHVRKTVLEVLPKLVPEGDGETISVLSISLHQWDQNEDVRCDVGRLLARYAMGGNAEALLALQRASTDEGRNASNVAKKELEKVKGLPNNEEEQENVLKSSSAGSAQRKPGFWTKHLEDLRLNHLED